jgi:DNA-binding response OmpR family regulator
MTDPLAATPGPVLLVEDDEVLAGIVARHLRARGVRTEVRDTAEDALVALRAGLRPSLVLLDINLPEATGWAVVRAPELQAAGGPPVVVVSATTVDPARLAEYGVAGYLPKPFPMETLLQTVERLTATGSPEGAL